LADLLEEGADIEAADEEGRTPLLLALESNRKEAIDVLIAAGKACVSQLLALR
jgi:ankyrin repeat protein